MAGIGFELKKLLNKKNLLSTMGGYFYATFVSVGPVIISVSLMIVMRYVMQGMGTNTITQNLVLSGIMYSFMGALVMSSAITMLLSRFISDSIYTETEEKILPSLISSLAINIVLTGTVTFCFYAFYSKLDVVFEILCYTLTIILSCMFVIMVYVSAVKDYKRITLSFLFGSIVGVAVAVLLIVYTSFEIQYIVLFSINISFLNITIALLYNVTLFFKNNFDDSYKEFFKYFKKYPSLIFINIFYMVTIFIHNIIIWRTEIGIVVEDTFYSSPLYDVPAFFAMITILPAMVIFVIKTETTFFDYYKDYIKTLSGGGTLRDLKYAGKNMKKSMYQVVISLLEVQLVITIMCILGARFVFPLIGLADMSFTFFGFLAIGYYCIIAVHILSSIILYFDDRKSALQIMTVFVITQIVFVFATSQISMKIYGLGTIISGTITLAFAFIRLKKIMNKLDYRLYCSQPIHREDIE